MGCQSVCALPLLLVGFSFALPVFGLALSALFFPAALHGQLVHPLAAALGEQPHSAVAAGPPLLYDIAEALQASKDAVEAFGVRDQGAGGGAVDHVLEGQIAEDIKTQLDGLGLDGFEGGQTGRWGRGAGGGVAAPLLLLLLLLLANCAGAPLLPCPLLAR